MIIPGTVRSLLHPILSKLIDTLKVHYIESKSYYGRYGHELTAAGCYVPLDDILTIRPFAGHYLAHVFLHELVHWTGHVSRLSRETFQISHRYGYYVTNDVIGVDNIHTEEATAQYGMYKLACQFNLMPEEARAALEAYLPHYPHADLNKARRDADLAVEYILNNAYGINCQQSRFT